MSYKINKHLLLWRRRENILSVPVNSNPLSVGVDGPHNNEEYINIMYDPEEKQMEDLKIRIYSDDEEIPDEEVHNQYYLGSTSSLKHGTIVRLHFFVVDNS